jgi:phage-related protein
VKQVEFYNTAAGNEVVKDFIRQHPRADMRVIGEDLMVLQLRHPVGPPLCKHLENGLWELRSSLPSRREARLFYFFHTKSQKIIVLHGFIKTTRTTPKKEIALAMQRMAEFD